MVGTRGVPARYGGFETCVEEVGRRLAEAGHDVVVYGRRTTGHDPLIDATGRYRGMAVVNVPSVNMRATETLSRTAFALPHLLRHRPDVALVFNAANSPLLPVLRTARIPVATHVDGLEWKRAKWVGAGRRYYRVAEQLAVRWSDALIADSSGIARYYAEEFGAATTRIAYGAPRRSPLADRLSEVGLEPRGYHLVVARFEPENNLLMIVRGYARSSARLPLVVVGEAPYSEQYTAAVRAAADPRVRFLGGVWDQELLDQLYAHAETYVHGHSVGGSNPSLLRAIGVGAAVLAYDVEFNREVLRDAGQFFAGESDLSVLLEKAESSPDLLDRQRADAVVEAGRYDWDQVAADYETLARGLLDGSGRIRKRPSGRRRGTGPW
jgi:glycosyltransferase involved in cell wall biosynthesis